MMCSHRHQLLTHTATYTTAASALTLSARLRGTTTLELRRITKCRRSLHTTTATATIGEEDLNCESESLLSGTAAPGHTEREKEGPCFLIGLTIKRHGHKRRCRSEGPYEPVGAFQIKKGVLCRGVPKGKTTTRRTKGSKVKQRPACGPKPRAAATKWLRPERDERRLRAGALRILSIRGLGTRASKGSPESWVETFAAKGGNFRRPSR